MNDTGRHIMIDQGPNSTEWWTTVVYMTLWQEVMWQIGLQILANKHHIIVGPGAQRYYALALQRLYGGYMPYMRIAQRCLGDFVQSAELARRYL